MANSDKAFGLRAVRHLSGGCVQTNEYTIASAYAANIFSGDPVQLVAGGTLEICAAAGADCIGVFSGCSYVNAAGEQVFSKYWPTGTVATDIKATVFDDPMIIFAVQGDATGVAAVDIGAQIDWEIVAGDTSIGQSKTNLDASAAIGTAAGLRVLRKVDTDDNAFGAYAVVEVIFSEHRYNTVGAGI